MKPAELNPPGINPPQAPPPAAGAGDEEGDDGGPLAPPSRSRRRRGPAPLPSSEELKMVLVVNDELRMGKGKIGAQCAHAAVGAVDELAAGGGGAALAAWEDGGQAKICLRCDTTAQLVSFGRRRYRMCFKRCLWVAPSPQSLQPPAAVRNLRPQPSPTPRSPLPARRAQRALEAAAASVGLPTYVVHDAGRTQVAAGSQTVLAIGPAPRSRVDTVTGHLKLL